MLAPKRILIPININALIPESLNKALAIAKQFGASADLLYVNDSDSGYRHPADFEDTVSLKVKESCDTDLLNQLQIKYAVSKGHLGDMVNEYCQKNKIDLIISTHSPHNKFFSSLFDTPDEQILDAVRNVPMLILPEPS